jgi:pimeloyl-ACP methyl ester carboxylesterase
LSGRLLEVNQRKIWVLQEGMGDPLLYLHGFADVHSIKEGWLPFHEQLSRSRHLIAPAHPGCSQTDENSDIETIEDVVFHYLEVLDAVGLTQFDLAGACVGGWIAAELAVRHPEKIRKLVLLGATGLFVEGALIADLFMMAQPERGSSYAGLRHMLFSGSDHPKALELFPDGMAGLEDELRRYQMLRFGSRIGFRPPYFYDYVLRNRLHRISSPTLIIWGEHDHMVPRAHGETYSSFIPKAQPLQIVPDAGHSVHVENPDVVAKMVADFLES